MGGNNWLVNMTRELKSEFSNKEAILYQIGRTAKFIDLRDGLLYPDFNRTNRIDFFSDLIVHFEKL